MGEDKIFKEFPNLPKMVVDFIKMLITVITGKDEELAAKNEELVEKERKLKEQERVLSELALANKKKEEEIKKLKERLGLNSRNSSKPPSSDGYDKPVVDTEKPSKQRSLRKRSGLKPGAQKGHKGHGMKFASEEPDAVEEHIPGPCMECPQREVCVRECVATQNEVTIVMVPIRIQHLTYKYACPMRNGEILTAEKPFSGTNRYGDSVIAFCELLFMLGVVSVNRICKIFKSFFGITIAGGTVQKFHTVCRDKVTDAIELVKELLIGSFLNGHDESGHRVNGRLKWLHVATNENYTLLSFQHKRGKEGMEKIGIINNSNGIAVTDCWVPYFTFDNVIHSLCCGHLVRELINRWQYTKQMWSLRLASHLLRTNRKKLKLIEQGVFEFAPEELERIVAIYQKNVAMGISINPLPERQPGQRGRLKRGKTRALLDRCDEHMYDFLRFAFDFRVPFTNNDAERELRANRLHENVSGCFRTDRGADEWADVMSYLKTAAKNNISAMDALQQALQGKAVELISGFAASLSEATE